METLRLAHVTFQYPLSAVPALHDVSLTLRRGDFAVLCGASGSGKSTLLRLLKPALSPHGERSGELLFDGAPVDTLPLRDASAKIGFVSQSPHTQLVSDKVWHELAFGAESLGLPQEELRRRVAETATYFGITSWLDRNTADLSGGEQQLLVLAGVMIMRPDLLLLDEPTSQLDPNAARTFLRWLQQINRDLGTTVLLSEHRLEEVLPLSSRVFLLEHGSLAAQGTPQEVICRLRDTQSPFLAAMPTAARLWCAIDGTGDVPCTINEGRTCLASYLQTHPPAPLPPETLASPGDCAIRAREVTFGYRKGSPAVLRDLDLSASYGEWLSLLGANGSGKSTLLRVLAGVLQPQHGDLFADGKVALLPQRPEDLLWHERVWDELYAVCDDETKIAAMLGRFRLAGLEDRHPADLSGGEVQRLALAKLLLTGPAILLLDEPTKGLDAAQKETLTQTLRQCCRDGMCVLTVSHDVEVCAAHSDKCALLFDGAVQTPQIPRAFFAQSRLYTTAAAKLSRDLVPQCVTLRELLTALGKEMPQTGEKTPDLPQCAEQKKQVAAKAKLPLWRKIGAVCGGCGATVSFCLAAKETGPVLFSDFGAAPALSAKQWGLFGAFAVCCVLLLLCLSRKHADAVPPLPREPAKQTAFSAVWLLLVLPVGLFFGMKALDQSHYLLLSLGLLALGLLPFFLWFERRRPSPRLVAVLAALSALAIAGRAAFFMLPQCKPVLAVVILAGVALGGESGFLVGSVTMLLSNLLFGQGPWTPYQMFAMGLCGALAGIFARCRILPPRRGALCVFGAVVAVVVYGGIMNPVSALLWGGGALNKEILLSYYGSGLPMDLIHAAATAMFLWALAPTILGQLSRLQTTHGPLT